MKIKTHEHHIYLNLNQIIALAFLGLIITGTFFLSLPFATKAPGSCGLLTALFTATSAVCVTGLSIVDVWSTFSLAGQIIILFLMEIGGLGFMSIVSILFYITNHSDNIRSLSLIAESLGSDGLKHITRIQKRLLIGSAIFELTGALILFVSFLSDFDVSDALWLGIFHSVSAFCNAGFDLMGIRSPGSSLSLLNGNPVVLVTVAFLIVIGGIGFVVWDDIATAKHIRNWSVYTKLVILSTAVFVIVGTVLFFIFESSNVHTMGQMSLGGKIVNSFFQSVTPRTAGFAAIDQSKMEDTSLALTLILMVIGGSAGSTAGGIKTVTFVILFVSIINSIKGKKNIIMFHRTISPEQISQAYTVASGFLLLGITGGFIITATSDISYIKGLFESISALATVGLSLGATDSLSLLSKIIVIIYMYIGRVGLLTLTMGFFKAKENPAIKYPSAKLII